MADVQTIVAEIRGHHRRRCYAMEQRKRANLALGSFLRILLGWSKQLPKDERDAINERAGDLIAIGEKFAKMLEKPEAKRKPVDGVDDPDFLEWEDIIMASVLARRPFDEVEAKATKAMEALAEQLPVWSEFGAHVHGFGAKGLAIIVGEAGDLGAYPKKGHLWKRMGVAVIDGVRQGGLAKTAPKAAWVEHGYNRQRRSRMFTVGDALVKKRNAYRDAYLARKEYERARAEAAGLTVAPSAKIPKGRWQEFMSHGQIDDRARRYAEKRLLRDLRAAWRRAIQPLPERAAPGVPAAYPLAAE